MHVEIAVIRKTIEVLIAFGQNLFLKDRILALEVSLWLPPIGEEYRNIEVDYLRQEPDKIDPSQLSITKKSRL